MTESLHFQYLNLALWVGFATAACAVLYGVYDENNGNEMTIPVAALYNAVHKTVWGAAVCWVIFACATGNGGMQIRFCLYSYYAIFLCTYSYQNINYI